VRSAYTDCIMAINVVCAARYEGGNTLLPNLGWDEVESTVPRWASGLSQPSIMKIAVSSSRELTSK
jgi:hypothetical protein